MELLYFLIFWLITGLSYFREDYNDFVKGDAYIFVCSIMFPLLHIATAATVLFYAKTNSTIRYFAIMVFELAAFMMVIALFQHYPHYGDSSLYSIFYLLFTYLFSWSKMDCESIGQRDHNIWLSPGCSGNILLPTKERRSASITPNSLIPSYL